MHKYIELLFVIAAKYCKMIKTIELGASETKYHSAYKHCYIQYGDHHYGLKYTYYLWAKEFILQKSG